MGGPYPAMEVKVQDTEDYKCTDVYPRSQARTPPIPNSPIVSQRVEDGSHCYSRTVSGCPISRNRSELSSTSIDSSPMTTGE